MLAFSSRKNKNGDLAGSFEQHAGGSFDQRGGSGSNQPLPYLDPTYSSPNAPAGPDLLKQDGLILRPRIGGGSTGPMHPVDQRGGSFEQHAGGSNNQPLPYLDPTISSPSAAAGPDLLKQDGLILRPRIGGFIPSVMKGVVNSGVVVVPLAALAAKRMWYGSQTETRKNKHGGGSKADWAHNREAAKKELAKYGNPSGLNINKYAALVRKSEKDADRFLTDYILRKHHRKTAKNTKQSVETVALWKNLVNRAKGTLESYGKPSGANTRKYASLRKKGLNTAAFLGNYQTRKKYVPVKTAKSTYKNNLQSAKKQLTAFGKPTAANLTKYVSLKRKGESTKVVEQAVKSRVKATSPDREKIRHNLQLLKQKMKGPKHI